MSTAIDMTPTEAQSTRIYAYILATATNGSPYDFGDYWRKRATPSDSLT